MWKKEMKQLPELLKEKYKECKGIKYLGVSGNKEGIFKKLRFWSLYLLFEHMILLL